ncbi:prolyl oligopeptidase family serine peptidase [Flavobacterium sp. 140616W15]|uniref:S9 family peptidase n=1 Tax=Flavobacterium sp. 140616W15 TaxID=2478552 RepID=UPI000F0C7A5C|nr:prolyl oligopeptidase family serine peptidase [Flavobacterium sp. 140616W15]AYN03592.1 S9 family peptidase [Flavobacterium sp. 140616W15]
MNIMIINYDITAFYNSIRKTLLETVFLFILPLVVCPLWGQTGQKRKLFPEDYNKWGRMLLEKVSPDEKWVSYKMYYESGSDTLFVRNIENGKTYSFANGKKSVFTADGFICMSGKKLQLLDFKKACTEIIPSVSQYTYLKNADVLVARVSDASKKYSLVIRKPNGKIIESIPNVLNFSSSPDEKQLIYIILDNNSKVLKLMDLKKGSEKKTIIESSAGFSNLTWSKNSKAFVFNTESKKEAESALHYLLIDDNRLFTIKADKLQLGETAYFTNNQVNTILISDDAGRVFFKYKSDNKDKIPNSSEVEIWNGNDRLLYLEKKVMGKFLAPAMTAVWNPFSNNVLPLTTAELPTIAINGDRKHALLYNPQAYEPQWEINSPIDLYVINTETGEKKLCIEKHSAELGNTVVSPMGKFIAYFKNLQWWIYNIEKDTHTCITSKINVNIAGKVHSLVPSSAYGIAGWSLQDNEVLIYDQFDIWAVSCDGSSSRRLTKGREKKIRFTIPELLNNPHENYNSHTFKTYNYDINRELILKAEGNDGMTGWYKLSKTKEEKPIVYENRFLDQLFYNARSQKLIFSEQDFNLSPRLVIKSKTGIEQAFFQSNPQQSDFYWGYSEMVYYQNSKGRELKGALFYPADYNPEKKYPMIVNIYEILHDKTHKYLNPTLLESTGFNRTVASIEGYFVFLPDIVAEPGNPGSTITDCINAAVKKVIEKNVIDPKKIGVIGHSFGGYESSFLITQTDLFAAAVAGNGISDLASMYLTVSRASGKSDMWRFGKENWMIGKTLMEAPHLYQVNSAVYNAEKVKTPLLLWAGREDRQVDMRQSMEYYLALRRLGKKAIMLLYPEEDHVLFKNENQKDLSRRIMQWFDFNLKDDTTVEWIKEGLN